MFDKGDEVGDADHIPPPEPLPPEPLPPEPLPPELLPPEPLPEPWNRPDSAVRPDGYAALELQSATRHPTELTDAEVIEAIRGYDHVASWAAARQARMLAEFAHRRPPDRTDVVDRVTGGPISVWAPDEIGLALTLSRGTAAARLERSLRLAQVLPATLAAWDAGRIDQAKVCAIHDATLALSDTAAQAVQDRVLPQAPVQTLAQLRAALERAVIATDPKGADARHRKAHRQRRVALNPERDGMASLWALLSAPDALSCYGWLTALARGLPAADPRSIDARRADLLVALLTGNLLLRPTPDTDPADTDPPATDSPITDTPRPGEDITGEDAGGEDAARSDSTRQDRAREDRAREDRARQDCARQDCAREDCARQDCAREDCARQDCAREDCAREDCAREDCAREDCAREDCPREDCPRQDCARQDCARQDRAREDRAREDRAGEDGVADAAAESSAATAATGGDAATGVAPPLVRGADLPTPVAPTKPLVHLVIPLSTLTGADDSPVELTGYGPYPRPWRAPSPPTGCGNA